VPSKYATKQDSTYSLNLAAHQRNHARKEYETATDHERNRRAVVEFGRPEGKIELGGYMSCVIHIKRVSRGPKNGESTEQGKPCEADAHIVDEPDSLEAGLVLVVLRIDLEVSRRRRAFAFGRHVVGRERKGDVDHVSSRTNKVQTRR
jgi:hypothetical protein